MWILVRLSGISSGTSRMRFSNTLLPMSAYASRWVPSLKLQRFSRGHTIWWQILRFVICRELHSQENWFEMVILYQQLPCFTSSWTLLSLFRKLSMEILDFSSFTFSKIARIFVNKLISIFFLTLGGCEEWFSGSVEVVSSSVGAKISCCSSIKQCAGLICLRDDFPIIQEVKGHVLCTSPFIRFSHFAWRHAESVMS